MRIVDLHVHSKASDGTLSPTELVKAAAKCGLAAFALTDHDTVYGVDEAINAAANLNLKVIPGIEISTSYKDKEIHIVDLMWTTTAKRFQTVLAMNSNAATREIFR